EGWLSTGDVAGHVRHCRDAYAQRIAAALDELGRFPNLRPFLKPLGGFCLFLRLPPGLSAAAVEAAALDRGVAVARGSPFFCEGNADGYLRFCTATAEPPTLRSGIQRLLRLLEHMAASHFSQPVS